MEKETLEDAAEKYVEDFELSFYDTIEEIPVKEMGKKDFIEGAKYQAERMYSEEDMINFANFKINNLMKHVDKTGFYLGTNKVLEIWKEEFKKK